MVFGTFDLAGGLSALAGERRATLEVGFVGLAVERTWSARKLGILTALDEYTRECLNITVGTSIPADKVIGILDWLFLIRGVPEHLRSDNGPEFVARAVQGWLNENGCQTIYITPGSPWENPYIESFHDKLREECLNQYLFVSIREAQEVVEAW